MPILRSRVDKQIEETAAKINQEIGSDNKYGSTILTYILIQVGTILLKKLLERVIADNGKSVVELAKNMSDNLDTKRRAFGDEQ
jgi:hypothetical protein|tara:strand:+ start:258 stop:509 length:252 start_codon:yes stop_codon:yes gene_type:complete